MKTEKPVQKQAAVKPAAVKQAPISKKMEEKPIVEEVKEEVVKPVEEVKQVAKVVEVVQSQPAPEEMFEEVVDQVSNIEEDPNRFNLELRDVVRVIRKSPLVTEVLLKSGDTVQLRTEDFEKLKNPNDPTSIIQHL